MSVWAGWVQDLEKAAGLPDTPDNDTFLRDWHASAASNCRNNPVDISFRSRGATNCKQLTKQRTAQNYTTPASAARAFAAELNSGSFGALRAALRSGHPYQVASPHNVIANLIVWGSETFAFELQQNYGPPHGGGGGGITAPHLLKGWHDMRRSTNRHLPKALRRSQRNINLAMRALSRGRKVKM